MASFFANVFGNVVGDAISGAFGMELTVRSVCVPGGERGGGAGVS